jgi:hypothetical protein
MSPQWGPSDARALLGAASSSRFLGDARLNSCSPACFFSSGFLAMRLKAREAALWLRAANLC